MERLMWAVGPSLVAGFAIQQLLELISPYLERVKFNKKILFGCVSLVIGLVLAFGAGMRILVPFGVTATGFWDPLITALTVSAATELMNSIVKLLGYAKEKKKQERSS